MFKHMIYATLPAALLHLSPGWASTLGNDACQALVSEGNVLMYQGKTREAWAAFARAHKADPAATAPFDALANLMLRQSEFAPADKKAELRKQAELTARAALAMEAHDPMALEILRTLQEDTPSPLHKVSLEAARLYDEGEALFIQKRYPEALAKYEQAAERDPLFSGAWVYAGDCFYMRQQWHEAELRYRKAIAIEPLNAQAWRFLSDALIRQGQLAQAQAALFSGIAAQPSQLTNWDKLGQLRLRGGVALQRLALVRKARAVRDPATGKSAIELGKAALQKTPDGTIWMLLAMGEANEKRADGSVPTSPFQHELGAWQDAMKAAAELEAAGKDKLQDPGLVTMQALARAGQLEPAILLLMYRESYRPDFEAWKRANPDGIKSFVATYNLRP